MLKKLIRQAKAVKAVSAFFVNRPNGYPFDLPDNILIFSRGGLSPVRGQGSIHHRHLLNLNLGAPCELLLDGHRFLLETGSAFLIYPYENHLFMHTDENIFRLMITFEVKNSNILPERHTAAPLSEKSMQTACELLTAYRTGENRWNLTLLLTLLLGRIREDAKGGSIPPPIPENASFSARIVRYIFAHLERNLSLDLLAKEFHLSKSHLRRRFQEETGISLGKYIRRSRIIKATEHLNRNEENISEIAELCGYSSIQAFSRAFREWEHISPIRYRAKRLKPQQQP